MFPVQGHGPLTQEDVLEHAIRLDLVQGGLKKALLVQILVIFIGKGAEPLSLLVEEIKIGGTLVGYVPVDGLLDFLLVPFNLAIPVVLLVFLVDVIVEGEVGLLSSILAFY